MMTPLDGAEVGSAVGSAVGSLVGSSVGSSVTTSHPTWKAPGHLPSSCAMFQCR